MSELTAPGSMLTDPDGACRCEASLAQKLILSESSKPVKEIMDSLEALVQERNFTVIARVDHGAAAANVDIPLRATEVLIFGNPRGGSLIMQAGASAAIDLPLRIVAWQESESVALVGYYKTTSIIRRHCIDNEGGIKMDRRSPTLGLIAGGFEGPVILHILYRACTH